jgi:hypothetical protein
MLCREDFVEECVDDDCEIGLVLEQIALRQELEIFKKWADGQLRESSALALLKEIRGDKQGQDLASIFNGDGEDD